MTRRDPPGNIARTMRLGSSTVLRALAWTYLLAVHALLAAFLLSPEFRAGVYWRLPPHGEETAFWRNMVGAQARLDATLAPGAAIFLGDSGVQSLDVGAIAARAVNYGIGSDTIVGVRRRLAHYPSLGTARVIVLLVGSNDLLERSVAEAASDYAGLVASLPAGVPLIILAVLPIDARVAAAAGARRGNRDIDALNAAVRQLCAARKGCRLVAPGAELRDADGNLRPEFHVGDGLHLAPAGYRVVIGMLRAVIAGP